MDLVMDKHVRTGTVVAVEKTSVVRVTRAALDTLCANDADFGHHFYKAIARGLARRRMSTDQSIANLRAFWKSHHH